MTVYDTQLQNYAMFTFLEIKKQNQELLIWKKNCVFNIGSADIDIILSKNFKSIEKVNKNYDITFKKYAIFLWHPVTSELEKLKKMQIN